MEGPKETRQWPRRVALSFAFSLYAVVSVQAVSSCARAGSCWREANLGNDDPGRYRLPRERRFRPARNVEAAYGGEFGRR
jgi:hypothetical protein